MVWIFARKSVVFFCCCSIEWSWHYYWISSVQNGKLDQEAPALIPLVGMSVINWVTDYFGHEIIICCIYNHLGKWKWDTSWRKKNQILQCIRYVYNTLYLAQTYLAVYTLLLVIIIRSTYTAYTILVVSLVSK